MEGGTSKGKKKIWIIHGLSRAMVFQPPARQAGNAVMRRDAASRENRRSCCPMPVDTFLPRYLDPRYPCLPTVRGGLDVSSSNCYPPDAPSRTRAAGSPWNTYAPDLPSCYAKPSKWQTRPAEYFSSLC